MSLEKIFIARKVANDLFGVETSIEKALADTAQFTASLPEARAQAKIPAVVGQEVFDSALKAMAALTEARRYIVEMHGHLDETKNYLGLRTVAFGAGMPKPIDLVGLQSINNKRAA